jgi:biopolymer transport protein ExbD
MSRLLSIARFGRNPGRGVRGSRSLLPRLDVCVVVLALAGSVTSVARSRARIWNLGDGGNSISGLELIRQPAAPASKSQPLQRGISVELAVTSSAEAMPGADSDDATIVTITNRGKVYLGINPIAPSALTEKLKATASNSGKELYIKADARTPYANVAKVLEAARAAGVQAAALLTAQPDSGQPSSTQTGSGQPGSGQSGSPQPGSVVVPKGLEVLLGPAIRAGSEPIIVQVLDSGQDSPGLIINHKPVPWDSLQSTLQPLAQSRNRVVVLERADGSLSFVQVVRVIDASRSAGKVLVIPAEHDASLKQ